MEISITNQTLDEIMNYMQDGMVPDMNNAGLSFEAMGFILTIVSNECERVRELLSKGDDE